MSYFTIILFLLLCLAIGWPLVRWLDGDKMEPLAFGAVSFLLGVGVVGSVGFIGAEIGLFIFWGVPIALTLIGSVWLHRREMLPKMTFSFAPNWVYGLVAVWTVWAILLFFRPHQFLLGAADAGVYINHASEIAANGRILINPDPILAAHPEAGDLFLRELEESSVAPYYLLPGFYAFNKTADPISPQFYHLHPVLQAVPMSLLPQGAARAQAGLLLTGLFGLAGALVVCLMVREVAGWPAALLALAGMSSNALQIWFVRYPTTESLSQFLLWSGIWGAGMWLGKRPFPRLRAAVGGIGFGLFFLTRIDAVLIVPVLVALALWVWLFDGQLAAKAHFFVPAFGLFAYSLLHGYFQSRHYFLELYGLGFAILRQSPLLVVAGVAVTIFVLVLLYVNRNRLEQLLRFRRQVLLLGVVLFATFILFNGAIRPFITDPILWTDPFSTGQIPILNHENLLRLGWYLSPVGIVLGTVGVCWMIWRMERETAVLLGVTLTFTLIYIWNIRANPHQIYTMRRYVPAVMPLFVVGTAVLLGHLWQQRGQWQRPVAALLAVIWLGGFAWSARGFVTQVDYANLPPQLDALNATFAPNSVILFNDQAPIGQGDILGTPLRFLYGHTTYSLRTVDDSTMVQLQSLIDGWQRIGKTVYLIHVPTNQTEFLPSDMTYLETYTLETSRLEFSYERKPTALQTLRYAGDVYQIESAVQP